MRDIDPYLDSLPERATMKETLRALDLPRRAPTEEDVPPVGMFPTTPASREAIRLRATMKPRRRAPRAVS